MESDMNDIADLVCRVVIKKQNPEAVASEVASVAARFNQIKFTFDQE
jgi:glycine/serine hydroxymethyltransferase